MIAQDFIEKVVREDFQKKVEVLGLVIGHTVENWWHVHRKEELPGHFVLRFMPETEAH